MIPGLCSDEAVWCRTITALGDEARCVVGDTRRDATLDGMARRILAQAPARFALAGVSMGGMVALELLRVAPERVTHLALVDTNARPDTPGRRLYRRLANVRVGLARDFERVARGGTASLVHPRAPDDVRRALVEMSVRVGPQVYVRQNRAVGARGDLRDVLRGIAIPTAVLVGRQDAVTPVALSEEIARLVPRATLQVVPDCGHLPPIERPAIVAAALRELLARA
jgi:pimeloyl-ACP methyl ester carboxylesterase